MRAWSIELLDAVERLFSSLPAGRSIRLSEIAHQVGMSIEEVEPAVVHLMGRGFVHQNSRKHKPSKSEIR